MGSAAVVKVPMPDLTRESVEGLRRGDKVPFNSPFGVGEMRGVVQSIAKSAAEVVVDFELELDSVFCCKLRATLKGDEKAKWANLRAEGGK